MEKIISKIRETSIKILGFNTEEEYNYLLKKIYFNLKDYQNFLLIENGFQVPHTMNVIVNVQNSLNSLDLNHLKREDIILTNNVLLNHKIQDSILKILQPLLLQDFESENKKQNFFVKHIVWIYERINELKFDTTPIILYYGEIKDDDIIHLNILKEIGVQIIFINSRVKNTDEFIKNLNISHEYVFSNFAPIEKFTTRINKAKDEISLSSNIIQTSAKQAKKEFENSIYKNGDIFYPWQFKAATTSPLYIDAIIEDIKTYWNQDARFREGFEVKEMEKTKVQIPNFFTKINGTYFDKMQYKELVYFLKDTQLTVFRTNTSLLECNFTKEDMFSLMFVMSFDKIDFEKIKTHKLYQLSRVNTDTQKFIIDKFNEFMLKMKNKVQQTDLLYLLAAIISGNMDFIKLIESFDFPFRVPKVVIFLEDRQIFNLNDALFLHYLNLIGLDIVIFSPMGSDSIEQFLFDNYLNKITLEEMDFELTLDKLKDLKKTEKKTFLQKIFK